MILWGGTSFAQSLDRIVGAWDFIAPAGCTGGCDTGMLSINAGGTVSGYDNLTFTSPTAGTWRAIDRSTYSMRTKNAIFNADGSVFRFIKSVGTVKISEEGESFLWTGTEIVLNPDGSEHTRFAFALSATRF